MQIHRILSLLAACAVASTSALDFSAVSAKVSDRIAESTNEDRIYGGTEASASKYPYIASIRKSAEGDTYCGGALIAPQYVITAAHCIKNTTMFVSLGSKFSKGSAEGVRLEVKESYIHPQYNAETHVNDVAILKLEKTAAIMPVQLGTADDAKDDSMAVVRGWGVTEAKAPSSVLLEVAIRIISNDQCNKSYDGRITKEMICAGEGAGKDSCQGDSGGPLVANDKLIGVVSWGGECGVQAGVYARLSTVLDFIKDKTGVGAGSTAPSASPAPSSAAPAPSSAAPAPSSAAPSLTPAPAASSAAPSTEEPEPTETPNQKNTPAPTTKTPTPAPSATTKAPTPSSTAPSKGDDDYDVTPAPSASKTTPVPSADKGTGASSPAPTPSKKKDCKAV
ncbi:hypothetical protein Poli38472_008514 [Pythium oligandrum]|uniref:Peptidase S1 domain-containing protein n=1 Tax=Pythium oligandrum TaxID=41045 RepID=A0A8K1C3J9_PYTOL|nr:hypothetical protein Poli38472_008514 [Pythium oligandrum]|eukprot:TMW55866.1 hypothetical protein Poli38472_008514 [Pythium oligandrum]